MRGRVLEELEGVGVARWRRVVSSLVEETIGIPGASSRVSAASEFLGAGERYTDCLCIGVGSIGGPCFRKLRIRYVPW